MAIRGIFTSPDHDLLTLPHRSSLYLPGASIPKILQVVITTSPAFSSLHVVARFAPVLFIIILRFFFVADSENVMDTLRKIKIELSGVLRKGDIIRFEKVTQERKKKKGLRGAALKQHKFLDGVFRLDYDYFSSKSSW